MAGWRRTLKNNRPERRSLRLRRPDDPIKNATMKRYLLRSVKYFAALCVLCIVLMGAMLLTGTSQLTPRETLYMLFHSDRFVVLGIAIVALAAPTVIRMLSSVKAVPKRRLRDVATLARTSGYPALDI